MNNVVSTILSLIKSGITGEKTVVSENTDWALVFKLCQIHQIIPIVFYGILNSNLQISNQETFFDYTSKAIIKEQNQLASFEKISKIFEEENIDYLPLKGIILKELYPKTEMRIMNDLDILFKPTQIDDVYEIMQNTGYVQGETANHAIAYNKAPYVSFEIHNKLISEEDRDYSNYFEDVWNKAKVVSGFKNRHCLTNEDVFIFVFVHLTKHYREGGIGIRHLLDIWVMLKKFPNMNMQYIKQELQKLKLNDFYDNILQTVNCWFEGLPFTDMAKFITVRTFKSGSYGTTNQMHASKAVRAVKQGGSHKNNTVIKVIKIIFLPLSSMKEVYPVLKKAPMLLPVMWVVRWFKTLFITPQNISKEIKRIKSSTNSAAKKYINELEYVGIGFE